MSDNLDLGGALRARWDYAPKRDLQTFNLDTVFLSAKYTSDTWNGAAEYRFYGGGYYPYAYTKKIGDVAFARIAWIGFNFNPQQQIQVGLNQVPFGLQPFFSSTFYETLGNVIGLEDLEEVGAKYVQQLGDWNLQAGYYARPAWQGKGSSNGRTYSSAVSEGDSQVAGSSNNRERNTLVLRIARALKLGSWESEVGISALSSTLTNNDTHANGRRSAVAIHYLGKNGPWGVQMLVARQQMSPRNQGSDELVSFGGYDGTYNVASRGNLYVADGSYDIAGSYLFGKISGIKLYANYSAFDKSYSAFRTSQRVIVGTSFSSGQFYVATEWQFGKNDPYIGGGSYAQSLGAGGNDRWGNQLYANIGYYF